MKIILNVLTLTISNFRAVIIMCWKNCVVKIEFRKIRSIMSKCIHQIFHMQTIPNQWIKRKVKDTKFIPNL